MPKSISVTGHAFQVTKPLDSGGQGQAFEVKAANAKLPRLVLKHMPAETTAASRTHSLIQQQLPRHNPYIAAPLLSESKKDGIWHVAPLMDGKALDQDDEPRHLGDMLESAHHLSCQLTTLEEKGLFHGDLAPSNVLITPSGEVSLIDLDNASGGDLPPPNMRGQDLMIAPEIVQGQSPNSLSDRFAMSILFNMLLFRAHPAEGQFKTPAERHKLLARGKWLERRRKRRADDIPISAIGAGLKSLFDAAASTHPKKRPSANDWRLGFHDAINDLWLHQCGNLFVKSGNEKSCPYCGKPAIFAQTSSQLVLELPSTAMSYKLALTPNQKITIGRANLGINDPYVSGQHLEITTFADKALIRHIGRNPTRNAVTGQKIQTEWVIGSQRLELFIGNTKLNLRLG